MATERAFAKVGYKDEQGNFVKQYLRAQDVFDTKGVSTEVHQTDEAIHLTPEQTALIAGAIQASQKGAVNGVAPLDADGKIPAQYIMGVLADCKDIADDYDALLALSVSEAALKTTIFVSDASGDATVDSGWAIYFRVAANGNADDWKKVMEGESLDIDFNAFIKQTEKGAANGVATLGGDGTIPNAQIKAANTGQKGITQLSSATDSEDEDKAATPKAVKAAKGAADTAQTTANSAVSAAATAQTTADNAVSAAATAQTAAETADGKAVSAQGTADTAVTNAATAQGTADTAVANAASALAEGQKLDFAFCSDEADMASKNLRVGGLVLMAVSNDTVDSE